MEGWKASQDYNTDTTTNKKGEVKNESELKRDKPAILFAPKLLTLFVLTEIEQPLCRRNLIYLAYLLPE